MQIPRWRLLLTGGAIVILGAVAVGIVQAGLDSGTQSSATAVQAEEEEPSDPWDGNLDDDWLIGPFAGVAPWLGRIDENIRERIDENVRERIGGWQERLDRRGPWRGGGWKRLARLDRLVHAEAVLDLPEQGLTRFTADVGEITAVGSDGAVTIARSDDQSVTLATNDETRVRKARERVEVSALAVGDRVLAVAVDQDGTLVARSIHVLPAEQASPDAQGEDATPSPDADGTSG